MNQLPAIRSFARVVETGSITRAADSLDMPKATVSKHIQDLEAHLGVRLVQRDARRTNVTADGVAYYSRVARLLHELDDVDESFMGANKMPRGTIRVDVGGMPGRLIILPALPKFFEAYPDVKVELGVGDRPVDLIGENRDCVIRGGNPLELSFSSRLLGTASWTTCATPKYLAQNGTPMHPNGLLSGHRMVGYQCPSTGRSLPAHFEREGQRLMIDCPNAVSINDGSARIAAGLAGLGIFQTFTYAIKDELARGTLVPILPEWNPPRYPFNAVFPENRQLPNRVRVFIDWLIGLFANLD